MDIMFPGDSQTLPLVPHVVKVINSLFPVYPFVACKGLVVKLFILKVHLWFSCLVSRTMVRWHDVGDTCVLT